MNKIVSFIWITGWILTAIVCYQRSLFQATHLPQNQAQTSPQGDVHRAEISDIATAGAPIEPPQVFTE